MYLINDFPDCHLSSNCSDMVSFLGKTKTVRIRGNRNNVSAIFQLYHDCRFNWWMKHEYPEKTTDLTLVNGKR